MTKRWLVNNSTGRILEEVFRRERISRGALGRATGATRFSLAPIIRKLHREGLIELSDKGERLRVNADYGDVVGIDLGASHLHFALADFRGNIRRDSEIKITPEDGPDRLICQIRDAIRALTANSQRRPLALGIGVPSAVDAERGVVAFANNLPGWKNIHLGKELKKAFRVPVFMENDVNMAALGEHWRGIARGVRNFVFIALGTGIGSGIFIDGKLYRGRSGWAGEVFRMNIDWRRWDEDFGDTGHLESCVSGMGIAAEGRAALGSPSQAESGDLAQERDARWVFERFRKGDPAARAVLDKVFTMLGVGIANVVAVLDPELIVLGGGVAKGAPEFMLETTDKVVRRIHKEIAPPIKLSRLADKAQTFGAICSALRLAREAAVRRLEHGGFPLVRAPLKSSRSFDTFRKSAS